MLAIAHLLAIFFYIGAAALAAAPFARPVAAPVRGVVALLACGVLAHLVAIIGFVRAFGQPPLTGIGPALSFAGFMLALILLVVELLASEVSLTLVAAPLAAVATTFATVTGLVPASEPAGARGIWLTSHIALSFLGIAGFATAAAAGAMYLLERRELKSRRFGAIFRFFPPLETLDRVNHVAAIGGWLALTLGISLAASYSVVYREVDVPQIVWGLAAWLGVTVLTIGRVLAGWQARRAAAVSSIGFAAVVILYVLFRTTAPAGGQFL